MSHEEVRIQMEKGLRPTHTPEGENVSLGKSLILASKGESVNSVKMPGSMNSLTSF